MRLYSDWDGGRAGLVIILGVSVLTFVALGLLVVAQCKALAVISDMQVTAAILMVGCIAILSLIMGRFFKILAIARLSGLSCPVQ